MGKYKDFVCAIMKALEEAAKLSDTIIDDIVAKAIHDAICEYLDACCDTDGKVVMMASRPVFMGEKAAALPAWLLPFMPAIAQLVQALVDRLVKK